MFNFLTDTIVEETKLTFEEVLSNIINWIATEGVKLVIGVFGLLIAFYLINIFSKRIMTFNLTKVLIASTFVNV